MRGNTYNKMHPREATDKIVIIDINEEALATIGQWPWPRSIMAELVTNLKSMGAKVVAFDMVFAESDRTSPKLIANNLPDEEEYASLKEGLLTLPDNDVLFSQAIKDSGNVVTGFTAARAEDTRKSPAWNSRSIFVTKHKTSFLQNGYNVNGAATNKAEFSSIAAGNGSFMATPDTDGIIRQVSLFNTFPSWNADSKNAKLYPMLGMEALRVYINPKATMLVQPNKERKRFDPRYLIKMQDISIPVESDSRLWVYYRDIKDNEYISANKILEADQQDTLKELVKDKIVFVGTSAEGLRDIRSTPLDIFIPGVEVHVNLVEQVLQGKYLKRPNSISDVEALIIASIGFLIIILAPFINALWLGLFTVCLIGGMFFSSYNAYVAQGLLIDPVYPSIVLGFLFLISSLFSYLRSETERRQVSTAFGHYISPDFMKELTGDPNKLTLGGEVRDLTVMFTDIRSFTKISESLSPEALIQLMNDFLTPMSNLVMESRGTIDKYMGDAMMAFWNAPLDDPEHARQACLTALSMNEALIPVNETIKQRAEEEGREPLLLSAGIGINTGPCSVGNMGSKQRFAYSALGDAVNLASRLEGQTKTYGVEILIGEDTQKEVSDLAFLELDLIKVIGREQPVKVYTLVGDSDFAQTSEFKKWQTTHNGMLAAYRTKDFDCAAQDCNDAMKMADGKLEKFYEIYQNRIAAFIKKPPPKNWGGVFIAKSK